MNSELGTYVMPPADTGQVAGCISLAAKEAGLHEPKASILYTQRITFNLTA